MTAKLPTFICFGIFNKLVISQKAKKNSPICLIEPFIINGEKLNITTSIGISIYPNNGKKRDTLITNADMAMYFIKVYGRSGYKIFAIGGVVSNSRDGSLNHIEKILEIIEILF